MATIKVFRVTPKEALLQEERTAKVPHQWNGVVEMIITIFSQINSKILGLLYTSRTSPPHSIPSLASVGPSRVSSPNPRQYILDPDYSLHLKTPPPSYLPQPVMGPSRVSSPKFSIMDSMFEDKEPSPHIGAKMLRKFSLKRVGWIMCPIDSLTNWITEGTRKRSWLLDFQQKALYRLIWWLMFGFCIRPSCGMAGDKGCDRFEFSKEWRFFTNYHLGLADGKRLRQSQILSIRQF